MIPSTVILLGYFVRRSNRKGYSVAGICLLNNDIPWTYIASQQAQLSSDRSATFNNQYNTYGKNILYVKMVTERHINMRKNINLIQNNTEGNNAIYVLDTPGWIYPWNEFKSFTDWKTSMFLLTRTWKSDETLARTRQNVIFELRYFMGKFGRNSSRIIVLQKSRLDISSNLNGVRYI